MPFQIAGSFSQDWYVSYGPYLAAGLSALLVFIITLYFNKKEHRNLINSQQQQVYNKLKGENDVMAEFSKSYAEAYIRPNIQRYIRARTGVPFEVAILSDTARWMRRIDKYSTNVDIQYGKLREILSSILFLFNHLNPELVNEVETSNRKLINKIVPKLLEKYKKKATDKIALIEPQITPIGKKLNAIEQQKILDIENSLMSGVDKEVKKLVQKTIIDPVKELLKAMKSDIDRSSWQFRK